MSTTTTTRPRPGEEIGPDLVKILRTLKLSGLKDTLPNA